ncbi:unnamed protein product [Aphanomyces euteiches]|uniref:Uncharacterized protein n=1 Tax=Aphanomyces euteiches TaxID=100861 RepID=A0A6G0W3Z8_9STRA|nr:hypothetical protein Ae201684_018975 [Aphanomyces euteiches]KAH9076665.1 hypothetical protein Ae201684P_010602 [Aphanomyces euteiches]
MSENHQTVYYEPLRDGNDDAFDAAMLEAIAFVRDTNMEEDDDYDNDDLLVAGNDDVDEEAELEGKRDANEDTATQGALSMNIAAIRQRKSRDTKKQLIQSWHERIEDLESHLAYLKREQRISDLEADIQAAQADFIKTQQDSQRLYKRLRGREQLRSVLQDCSASTYPQKVNLLVVVVINRTRRDEEADLFKAYNLSQEEYQARETTEKEVKDFLHVKLYLDEDDHGTCIEAIEYHLREMATNIHCSVALTKQSLRDFKLRWSVSWRVCVTSFVIGPAGSN